MGTDSRRGVTAAYFANVYPQTLARTERDEGNDVMAKLGKTPVVFQRLPLNVFSWGGGWRESR